MDVILRRFVRADRIPAVHPPLIPPLAKLGRRESGEAPNAFDQTERGCVRSISRSITDYSTVSEYATGCGWASPQLRSTESCGGVTFWEMPLAKALFLLLAALTLSAQAGVSEVGAIG